MSCPCNDCPHHECTTCGVCVICTNTECKISSFQEDEENENEAE